MDLNKTTLSLFLAAAATISLSTAQATELSANYSAPSQGADMWIGYMGRNGYFVPHYDDCDVASEAFVAVAPDGKGFCMELNERSAAYWEDARHDCLSEGKRLPEPAEFRYACRRAATLGLNGMDNAGPEWASNFATPMSTNSYGVAVPYMGSSSCNHGSWGTVAWSTKVISSATYRCVR